MSNEAYYCQALMCRERVMKKLAQKRPKAPEIRSKMVKKWLPVRPEPWVVDAAAAKSA